MLSPRRAIKSRKSRISRKRDFSTFRPPQTATDYYNDNATKIRPPETIAYTPRNYYTHSPKLLQNSLDASIEERNEECSTPRQFFLQAIRSHLQRHIQGSVFAI